jgi:hypothetical protein
MLDRILGSLCAATQSNDAEDEDEEGNSSHDLLQDGYRAERISRDAGA